MKEFIEKLIGRLEEIIVIRDIDGVICGCNLGVCEDDDCLKCLKKKVVSIVNQLAEEYNGGWISANNRLPEENGKYIVYYRKWTLGNYLPKFDEKEIRILRYSTNGWFFPTYGDVEAEKDIHREVIAWQPLPEPFKG